MQQLVKLSLPRFWPGIFWVLTIPIAMMQDVRVFLWSRTLSADKVNFFQAFTQIGHSTWMLVLSSGVAVSFFLFARIYRNSQYRDTFTEIGQKGVFVFVSIAGAGLIAVMLKYLIGRARPFYFSEFGAYYLSPISTDAGFASFPSGHSTNIFALALSLCVFLPQVRIPLLLLASGIAFSRVAIGEHFLSDIVGGALLSYLFVMWWQQRAKLRKIIPERPMKSASD